MAIEAARNKRRAIVCDLNPAASHITELTLRPVNTLKLLEAFERVRERVQKRVEELYTIHCLKCGQPLVADCFVREGENWLKCDTKAAPIANTVAKPVANRARKTSTRWPNSKPSASRNGIRETSFIYHDGEPFKEKQKYDSLDQLFTKRNLRAAAMIHEAIEEESSPQLRKFLLGAFTSMIHLCTRMMPVGNPAPSNHYTFFSSPGWTQHSYWSAARYHGTKCLGKI